MIPRGISLAPGLHHPQDGSDTVADRSESGPQEWVSPDWWGGASGDVWVDSTLAVQSAFDSAASGIMLMGGGYRVSRVSLEGSGRTLEGRGGSLVAMTNARPNPLQLQPPGTLNAVLEIKCIGSHIQNLGVGAAYNGTCTCPSFSLLRGVSLTSGDCRFRHCGSPLVQQRPVDMVRRLQQDHE